MSNRIDADIVVIGGGPAGIAAACSAAESERKVTLIDNMPAPGGNIWRGMGAPGKKAKDHSAARWLERLSQSKARIISQATVFAAPGGAESHLLQAETPEGLLDISWRRLVIAVGGRELFIPFPGWTLPNVFGVGGLQALVKGGWPIAGKRVVVAGSGPLLLAAAAQFRQSGATIAIVAEQADLPSLIRFATSLPLIAPSKLLQAVSLRWKLGRTSFRTGCWVIAARGEKQVERVMLTDGVRTWDEPCDYLACSYSMVPSVEIPLLLGCRVENGAVDVNGWQETSVPDVFCAGEPNGIGGVDCALIEGRIAGYVAAEQRDNAELLMKAGARAAQFRKALREAFELRPEILKLATAETIVCRCEDVTRGRLEGYANWRAAKLHTRCGMGACQGRVCGGAVQQLFGWEGASVRPPVLPVSVDSLAHQA